MKIRFFNKVHLFLPLLLTLLNVIGSNVYSFHSAVPDLASRNYDYLQEDQNTSANLFAEISIGNPVQLSIKDDLVTGNDHIPGHGLSNNQFSWEVKLPSVLVRDKKEILKAYIFPFHFFW